MQALLKCSRGIDALNEWVGRHIVWLILIMVLISAGNAIVRKVFNSSSNSLLEIQWYLFSAVFLLGAGHALLRNAHVRIDVITGRFSQRVQAWIDLLGTVFFLLPVVGVICWLSWPWFVDSWQSGEVSASEGGLVLWPARLLMPVGFALLLLQGLSELVKRAAFLMGLVSLPVAANEGPSDEEALAEDIRRARGLSQDEAETGK
ncbi:TRAP transporter small permease subunit [Viridibacterium curvum]|uniref:TRAP transporter small permease protein n=1 Tax=Viridibacterium curvum TaxID=1101404 RepID=A0ABP9QAG6_9RHOO